MNSTNNIQAYILAGGKSSRMGTEKGLVTLLGKPFIKHIIDTIKTITPHITIVANSDHYNATGYPVIADIIKDKGPLSGIYTGLTYSEFANNLFVSCDMPLINYDLIDFLISQINSAHNATVVSHIGKTEPLCGVYSKSALPIIKSLLETNQLSVHNALTHLSTQRIDVSLQPFYTKNIFFNINSPVELKQLEEELS